MSLLFKSNKILGAELAKDRALVKNIVDLLYNILQGNVEVSPKMLSKLKTYKQTIYKVVRKSISVKKRVKILQKNLRLVRLILPLLKHVHKNVPHK